MRGTLLSLWLASLVIVQSGLKSPVVDEDRAIPRFVLQNKAWVCLDRDPRQVHREDCKPRWSTRGK
jgi:hypothetical protein